MLLRWRTDLQLVETPSQRISPRGHLTTAKINASRTAVIQSLQENIAMAQSSPEELEKELAKLRRQLENGWDSVNGGLHSHYSYSTI